MQCIIILIIFNYLKAQILRQWQPSHRLAERICKTYVW